MAPALAADAKIPCPTPHHLKEELETLTWALEPEEKEDTWEKFERAIIRFSAVTRGGGYKHTDLYIEGVGRKGVGPKLAKCMLSDRGRLSGVSTDLLQTFAPRLSTNFKPLVNLYLEPLIDLLGRPNKVFLKRAEKCLLTIITHCQINTILPELRRGLNDNAATCRRGSGIAVERTVKEWPGELWTERYLAILEESVKKMAIDKDPEVRQTGKRVWALFNDMWPERVDNFSAPLTPTIRRYLDISANGADPSKPKPKAVIRPALVAVKPISAASSESSHASGTAQTAINSKPQNNRVNALATKPMRPLLHPQPSAIEAGPSRRRSPKKNVEQLPPVSEHEIVEIPQYQPALSRSKSSSNRLHNDFAVPPALGWQGRSVSHNILPSVSSMPSFPSDEIKHYPLSKPTRPVLLPAHSAPAESTEIHLPPRRFAPPARIMRVVSTDEEGGIEHGDHPFTTPSGATVIRGPQRNLNGGAGRRGNALGQAHRRVVTGPSVVPEDGYFAKTPGGGWNKPRQETDEKLEEQQYSTKADNHRSEKLSQAFASPIPAQVVSMDSPLMPILIRSTSGEVRAMGLENESDFIDMKEDVYPASPLRQKHAEEEDRKTVEVARKIELPESPKKANEELDALTEVTKEDQAVEVIMKNSTIAEEGERVITKMEEAVDTCETQEQEQADCKVEPTAANSEKVLAVESLPVPQAIEEIEEIEGDRVPQLADIVTLMTSAPEKAGPKPLTRVPSTAGRAGPETQGPAKPNIAKPKVLGTTLRKPPVPAARSVPTRTVSAPVVRKPFKPTNLTAPTATTAARAAASVRAAPATTAVSRPVVSTSTTAKTTATSTSNTAKDSTLNNSTSSKPTTMNLSTARARVVSAQVVSKTEPKPEPKITSKPSLPATARAAPTRIVSGPKKPTVTAHVTLPPVKKERVFRKAPLPSFRPARNGPTITTASSDLKASTSSVTSVRAKVKPEMIELPKSPAKPSEVPLPPSPHEIPLPHSPVSKATSVISSISRNNTHKSSPLKVEIRARVRQDSIISVPQSPIKVAPAKPLSPLLTMVEPDQQESQLAQPVFAIPTQSGVEDNLNGLGLPTHSADPFSNHPPTPHSKLSTSTTSEAGDISTDTDESVERITFKSVSADTPENHPSTTSSPSKAKPAFGSRSDVSTPGRSAAMLLAKLEGSEKGMNMAMSFTPGPGPGERKALSVKDTNTPATSAGHSSEGDWDISA
ncbi:uncharacterized protein IL334_005201 [Kwoniella shivajii]|uniref:CLASP N-terminal domain-containing protein n=1 Tax=Kwoniella shivajii TaxID=564305 RepID=A0ABZ1D499_9TREE|nr:hypothetical protein IL334_005201 [Kwoniella shivajii]